MLIFKIKTQSTVNKILKSCSHASFVDLSMQSWHEDGPLKLNTEFMQKRYGFTISEYDRDCFLTHHIAWQEFKKKNEEYCLIFEDTATINLCDVKLFDEILNLLKENQDWDIFFPFDRTNTIDRKKPVIGYILGYPWGSDAYFITRKGVDKLLEIQEIKQPVDEEILNLLLAGKLEVYYKNTELFSFTDNNVREKRRKDSIKNALFNSNIWTVENKEKAIALISKVSSLAKEAQLDLVLSDGSLLGFIRHGGIMPWDDDIDFAIDHRFIDFFKSYIENHSNLKTKLSKWVISEFNYLKIWDENGQNIDGHLHKWPFIDIWPYFQTDTEIIFPHGKKYAINIFYPFSDIEFEGSVFKLLSSPLQYLDILYPDWRTNIQIFAWNHQKECGNNILLNLEIAVDDQGRILQSSLD